MRRFLSFLAMVVVLSLLALVVATWRLSRPIFDESLARDPLLSLTIAPIDRALTLARMASADGAGVVLVTDSQPGGLSVIDLEAEVGRPLGDALAAFDALGYVELERIAREGRTERVPIESLALPFDPVGPHMAAGANYRAHAEEVGVEDGPFLFPKLSTPTPWNADVPHRGRLDYEAELCAVPLTPHSAEAPARLGFVLCNDFTDRWMLAVELDFDAPMGTTGFPDAKGGPGMLPIGPFLVIPRDADAFYRDLDLELYANERLRQRVSAASMVWSPEEIVQRAVRDCAVAYQSRAGELGLTDCGGIPAGTLILTGTPGGVMFHVLTIWAPAAYLEPGDEVWTVGRYLGALHNRVR
jgi:2-keto-4-pentenoate hydratase/2-oxohepta-3-ene-1,7-dioic acid hydratase in catechol pathway